MRTGTTYLFKQDGLSVFGWEKVRKFVRYLSSLLIVSIFEASCEVTVRRGGVGRRYEMVVFGE